MKANFALSLSFEGIRLLHRAAGGWRLVGDASLEDPDLSGALTTLRKTALGLEQAGLRTKLIIPNDQIKYLSIDTPGASDAERRAAAERALDGATPYPVSQLAFDICPDDDVTHIAAVACETLQEAEGFAVEHRFAPISVVAVPEEKSGFLGEPFFGPTRHAVSLVAPGDSIEPDNIAVVVVGDLQHPAGPVVEVDHGEAAFSAPDPRYDGAEAGTDAEISPQGLAPEKTLPDAGQDGSGESRFPLPPVPKAPDMAPNAARTGSIGAPEIVLEDPIDPNGELGAIGFSSRRGKPQDLTASRPTAPLPARVTPQVVEPIALSESDWDVPAADHVPAVEDPHPASEGAMPAGLAARLGTIGNTTKSVGSATRAIPASLQKNMQRLARERPQKSAASQARLRAHNAEKQRLTVFGARQPNDDGTERSRPRFLGLILTAMLLLFLAGLAIWWPSLRGDDTAANSFAPEIEADEEVVAVQPQALTEPVAPEQPELQSTAPVLPAPTVVEPEPESTQEDVDVAALDPEILVEPEPVLPEPTFRPKPEEFDPETAQEHYAVTGIWTIPPTTPDTPGILSLDNLYLTSIDRTDLDFDAVALPREPGIATDLAFVAPNNPPPPGTEYDLDERGFVVATPEGAETPEGALVFAGKPSLTPRRVPERNTRPVVVDIDRAVLAVFRPRLRPADLQEKTERSNLGGLSRSELAEFRPRLRPASLQIPAPPVAEAVLPEPDPALAGVRPSARPRGFAALVAKTRKAPTPDAGQTTTQVAAVAPQTVSPRIPSSASVAKQATVRNAINLKKINLMGVYGTPSNRRALVRLSNGRYKKVKVGDRIDGGRVSAIGESELRYQKSGRNIVLKMPKT